MASATLIAVYTAHGTFTWTCPSGVSSAYTECWGGGGRGQSSTAPGHGGGGGEYAAEPANTVVSGTGYTVVVGAGATSNAGGGSSSFTGAGATTTTAHGGNYGATGSGAGGTGSTNTVSFSGGAGGAGSGVDGGGGGSSAGPNNTGNAGSVTTGGAAVPGGGPGGTGGVGAIGNAPVSGPGGGGGGSGSSLQNGGNGFDGKATVTCSANSPLIINTATTSGTYTWTAPTGITSVSWQITGTASFDGNSSSGHETVVPGTAYTISVSAGGSLTISWGSSGDIPQILPGPTWYDIFKPYIPRPRVPVPPFFVNKVDTSGSVAMAPMTAAGSAQGSPPPMDLPAVVPGPAWMSHFKPGWRPHRPPVSTPVSGPNAANLPNLSDIPTVNPGAGWLEHFKPGMAKPRPQVPALSISNNPGTAAMAPMGISGSVTVNPTGSGGVSMAPMKMTGVVRVPIITSGSVAMAPAKFGTGSMLNVPIITSGSAAMAPMGILTPVINRDLRQIQPGPTWLDKFKPGLGKILKINASQQYIGASGSVAMAPMGIASQIIQYLPFPQFPLNLKIEILINGTWLDITSFVFQRDGINITRGLPDETQSVTPSQMTLTLSNRDGRFSPNNPNGAYFPFLTRNTQVRCSVVNQASADGAPYSGYRFWGEISSFPPRWDSSQSDIYCQIVVSGVLRRYVQGAPLGSTLYQYYTSLTGNFTPYGYWPCEDGSKATEIASALPSIAAATFTGDPQFASDASFGGSDPIPVISSSVWHAITGAAANPPGTGTITQKFPGTYHWTAPPGVTQVTGVICIGAGGGGGDQNTTIGGGGGGGGGTGKATTVTVTPGQTYTYVVGAGGSAGAGGGGTAGADSTFTGNSQTVTGKGAKGGNFGSSGGAGGAGTTFNGGAGGTGTTSSTSGGGSFTQSQSLTGFSGGTSGGHGGTAAQQTTSWTAPDGVQSPISVTAVGGGGGGHGGGSAGAGGGGGGGGGSASGDVDVTAGNSYTFSAGNGGSGGGSNQQGDAGAASGVNGDSQGCFGNGGGGSLGQGGGPGGGIVVGSGGGSNGSSGGSGANQGGGFGGGGGGGGGSGQNPGAGQNGQPPGNQTRVPGPGGGNGSGGGWGTSSYPGGSGATNGGTGGSNGGGGGGGGSVTSTSGNSGGGGGAGIVQWSWTVSNPSTTIPPGGGGGGSSAGTSTSGNAGSSSGTGGSAPAGGGAGGTTGTSPAGVSPGGGGAGGVPDNGSGATVPGAGAPGEVSFSWSGGATSPVAADIIRFALHVDSAGAADGAILLQALTYGTIGTINLIYHTGGNLELIGFNQSSVQVFDSGLVNFSADGTPLYMSIELTGSGSNATWKLTGIKPGSTSAAATATGTVTGVSVGNVSDVFVDPAGTVVDSGTSLGQITVQTYADTLANLSPIVNGFAGELAADRISRLCTAQGIGFELVGANTDTPQMGPQQDDTFVNILQSCADLDRGQLFETRDQLGIGYRTRIDMQGQNPAFLADYSLATLAGALQPTADDQYTRNSIQATRNGGASATAQLTTGAMSILTPPNGVGLYSQSLTVQAFSDSQLASLVAWLLTVGTVSEYRYPQITFDMSRIEVEDLFTAIPSLDIGDFVQVINVPNFLQSDPISQLCWGFSEQLNAYTWVISINTVPESPYSEGNPPTW